MFNEEHGVRSLFKLVSESETDLYEDLWDGYWETWLGTDIHTNSVRAWLRAGVELGHRFDDAALCWMKAASKSTKMLFKAWLQPLARMWLVKSGFDDLGYFYYLQCIVWFMHGLTLVVSPLASCSLAEVWLTGLSIRTSME